MLRSLIFILFFTFNITPLLSSHLEFLNEPADHTYASLSFELPVSIEGLDPLTTKSTLNSEILKKNTTFPLMSMEEPWQKNLHITITGFPNIPSKHFTDPELLSQMEQLVQRYMAEVNGMMRGKLNLQLNPDEPIKVMPYKTMKAVFAIPSESIKDTVERMEEVFPIIFKDLIPTINVTKRGKLGVHMTLDINERKYYTPRILETLNNVLTTNKLEIVLARATVLYHTEKWK